LRSRCGEVDPALATWWTEVQSLAPEERHEAFGGTSTRRRRGGRRRRARAGGSAADGAR
jgi:Polymerase A arginine-rich C-terminus